MRGDLGERRNWEMRGNFWDEGKLFRPGKEKGKIKSQIRCDVSWLSSQTLS